jgi:predicted kinase
LQPLQASGSDLNGGIYSPEATTKTYRHLLELAGEMLQYGFSVIVDAAFLKQAERRQFHALAKRLQIPFAIVAVDIDETLQRQRLGQRQNDASEAGPEVLDRLKTARESLASEECDVAVELHNNGAIEDIASQTPAWERLNQLLRRPDAD